MGVAIRNTQPSWMTSHYGNSPHAAVGTHMHIHIQMQPACAARGGERGGGVGHAAVRASGSCPGTSFHARRPGRAPASVPPCLHTPPPCMHLSSSTADPGPPAWAHAPPLPSPPLPTSCNLPPPPPTSPSPSSCGAGRPAARRGRDQRRPPTVPLAHLEVEHLLQGRARPRRVRCVRACTAAALVGCTRARMQGRPDAAAILPFSCWFTSRGCLRLSSPPVHVHAKVIPPVACRPWPLPCV